MAPPSSLREEPKMANREETPKASIIAQAPRTRHAELSDIGAVRDPELPHGFTASADIPDSSSDHHDYGPDR
jgi:hypothetical protein